MSCSTKDDAGRSYTSRLTSRGARIAPLVVVRQFPQHEAMSAPLGPPKYVAGQSVAMSYSCVAS
jgi:hypothetical protein